MKALFFILLFGISTLPALSSPSASSSDTEIENAVQQMEMRLKQFFKDIGLNNQNLSQMNTAMEKAFHEYLKNNNLDKNQLSESQWQEIMEFLKQESRKQLTQLNFNPDQLESEFTSIQQALTKTQN